MTCIRKSWLIYSSYASHTDVSHNPCVQSNKSNCEQICISSGSLSTCSCRRGYELTDDNVTCSDVDECSRNDTCEYECKNEIGSYGCSCAEDYDAVSYSKNWWDERTWWGKLNGWAKRNCRRESCNRILEIFHHKL